MVPVAMCTGETDRIGTERRRDTCPLANRGVPGMDDGARVAEDGARVADDGARVADDGARVADNRRTTIASHRYVHTHATVTTATGT